MEARRITQIKSTFSFAVMIVDSLTGSPPKENGIEVELVNIPQKPVRKLDGIYVFSNIEHDDYTVLIKSKNYYEEFISITAESLFSNQNIVLVSLNPKPNYTFSNQTTLIRCMLQNSNGQLVSDANIVAKVTNLSGPFVQLDQEKIEEGKKDIVLSGKVFKGDTYYIRDRKHSQTEFCRIYEMIHGLNQYRLEDKLQLSYHRGATFLPVIHSRSTNRGEVSLPIRNYQLKKIELDIRITFENIIYEQHIEIEAGTLLNLGNLTME